MSRSAMPDDAMELKEQQPNGAIHENITRKVWQDGGDGDSVVCNVPKAARSAIGIHGGDVVRITVYRDGYFVEPLDTDSE